MKVWICDIDGTVAIMGDRSPFDWSRVGEDTPNEAVIRIVRSLIQFGDKIIFVSGRMEQSRKQTELWLDANVLSGLFQPDHMGCLVGIRPVLRLHMRDDGDYRADHIVKRELYEKHILGKYDVIGTIDDRSSVVELWRDLGLTCLDVAGHDF